MHNTDVSLPQILFFYRYPFFKISEDEYALLDFIAAGFINARKMLEAERKVAQKQGCQILFDTVKDVTPRSGNYHTVCIEL